MEIAQQGGWKPEIINSDRECQFTSADIVAKLQGEEIRISWSLRRRCYDDILVERLWRKVKYEEVYQRASSNGWEAELPMRSTIRSCSSRPEFTMTWAQAIQQKAPASVLLP